MAHIPHLLIEPSDGDTVALSPEQRLHLEKVLRYKDGLALSYTDGAGLLGSGTWVGGQLIRGEERQVPERSIVTIAVAPPKAKDRQRLIVEKLGELGVSRLIWLTTRFGQVRPPAPARTRAWAIAALEQSRSAFLLEVGSGSLEDLPDVVLADTGGGTLDVSVQTLAIGPEGGWHPDELVGHPTVRLSEQVLRTETAAIVGGALLRGPHMVT
jgi:RsmE family RNA methyltransferase